MSQVLSMKLTELTNICYISDRVPCTTKMKIKETFLGKMVLLQMFIYWLDCSQRIKDLSLDIFSTY